MYFDFQFFDSSISRMATIQLFFNEKVFLVDCVILEKIDISEGMWKKFFESLFHSKKLTVIGFDMKNDMEALFTVRPIRDDFRQEDVKNFICVKRFVEILNEYDASILSLTKKSCRLITLVEELLNLTMDKTEQTGNWQCRPLRKNQIVYASLDAVIVLDLFRKIFEIVKQYEKQVEIDKLLDESRSFVTVKKEKVKKETKVLTASPWENMYEVINATRVPIYNINFISDSARPSRSYETSSKTIRTENHRGYNGSGYWKKLTTSRNRRLHSA